MRRDGGSLLAGLAIMLALAGCGGGSHKTSSTTSSTAKSTTATTAPARVTTLTQTVALAVKGATPGSAVTAKSGQLVVFRTALPSTAKTPTPVTVTIQRGPATKLTVVASGAGQQSTATVNAAAGAQIKLVRVRYVCRVAPSATVCPGHASVSAKRYRLTLSGSAAATPVVVAEVGPVRGLTTSAPAPGTNVVPAYTVSQQVATRAGTAQPSAFAASATAKPGDIVIMATHVGGAIRTGATQPVTVAFNQGPATSLTVTATVPGGKPSQATIKGANGSRIALVLPQYTCYLPPMPTICPAIQTAAGAHRYALTFPGAPLNSPLVVQATAAAG